jgi:3-oxoacyl-[acyl-carrier-protein] synthase III
MINFKKSIGISNISYQLGQILETNFDLGKQKPNWNMDEIKKRSGVESRVISKGMTTALDLAIDASRKLFEVEGIDKSSIDAIIFCSQTPSKILPPNSTLLHGALDLKETVMTFDISHGCSGFTYSLGIARSLIISETAKNVLIVNSDTYSKIIDPNDKSVRPLFGDAGAVTFVSKENIEIEIVDINFGTCGKYADFFQIEKGILEIINKPVYNNETNEAFLKMKGFNLLSFFGDRIIRSVEELLEKNDIKKTEIDYFIFHQASKLSLDMITKSLEIEEHQVIIDMENTGNLVSASIPVVLKNMLLRNDFKKGQLLVLCGFGVGLSWSSGLCRI